MCIYFICIHYISNQKYFLANANSYGYYTKFKINDIDGCMNNKVAQ